MFKKHRFFLKLVFIILILGSIFYIFNFKALAFIPAIDDAVRAGRITEHPCQETNPNPGWNCARFKTKMVQCNNGPSRRNSNRCGTACELLCDDRSFTRLGGQLSFDTNRCKQAVKTYTDRWAKYNAQIIFEIHWRDRRADIAFQQFSFIKLDRICSTTDKFNYRDAKGNVNNAGVCYPKDDCTVVNSAQQGATSQYAHLLVAGNCDCTATGRVPYKICCKAKRQGNDWVWKPTANLVAKGTDWSELDDGNKPLEAFCRWPNQYGGKPAPNVTRCPEHLRVTVIGNGIVAAPAGADTTNVRDNGIECGSGKTNCQENYRYTGRRGKHNIPRRINITAVGKVPKSWSGCDRIGKNNAVCTVSMNASRAVTVTFDDDVERPPGAPGAPGAPVVQNCSRCSNLDTKKGCLIGWRDTNKDGSLDPRCDDNWHNSRTETCPAPDSRELLKNCKPSCALAVKPGSVKPGERVTLRWTTVHGDRIVITGRGINEDINIGHGTEGLHRFNNRGEKIISAPTSSGNYTYTAVVSNAKGKANCTTILKVRDDNDNGPPAPAPAQGRIIDSFTVNNNPFNSQAGHARLACLPRHDNNFNPLNPSEKALLRWSMFQVGTSNSCVNPKPTRPVNPPGSVCHNDDGSIFRPTWSGGWHRIITGGTNYCRIGIIKPDHWWDDSWHANWRQRKSPLFESRTSYNVPSHRLPKETTDYFLDCQRERYTCQWARNYIYYHRPCVQWDAYTSCIRRAPCTPVSSTVFDRIEYIPSPKKEYDLDRPAYREGRVVTLVVVPKPKIEKFIVERGERAAGFETKDGKRTLLNFGNPLKILLNHFIDVVWRAKSPSAGENISTELRCQSRIISGDDKGQWKAYRSDQKRDNIFRQMFNLLPQGRIDSATLKISPQRTTEFGIQCRNVYYGREGTTSDKNIVCLEDSDRESVKVEVYKPELEEKAPTN